MHPGVIAQQWPDRPAVVMHASGRVVTYGELDARSNQLSHFFRSQGVLAGGRIAVLMPNHERYFEICWAAQRSGIYYVPLNHHLSNEEVGYIVSDCGASLLIVHGDLLPRLGDIADIGLGTVVVVDGDGLSLPSGCLAYEDALAGQPHGPVADEQEGAWMFYSSGTTGRPKGIRPSEVGAPLGTPSPLDLILRGRFGFDGEVRYLVPAPLYHAAPLGWSIAAHRVGGTVIVLERFDADACLDAIDVQGITHAQFVPTHFVRLLKLEAERRAAADVSSLRFVVHAAAPCAQDVKRAMIDWFGPIVYEFYSGSEGVGFCMIDSADWLAHPGSVGRSAVGVPHILDETANEVAVGEVGQIWFDTPVRFAYHNAPEKDSEAWNDRGWATFGDLGRVDADGYLYLADRRTDLVITGGVNIYPREIEDALALHPDVADVACVGAPDDELGQILVGCIRPAVELDEAGWTRLEQELTAYLRSRLATYKTPRRWLKVDEMPRMPTGKLRKRELADLVAQPNRSTTV